MVHKLDKKAGVLGDCGGREIERERAPLEASLGTPSWEWRLNWVFL